MDHYGSEESPFIGEASAPDVRAEDLALPEMGDGSSSRPDLTANTASGDPPASVGADPSGVDGAGENSAGGNSVGSGDPGVGGENSLSATRPVGSGHADVDDSGAQNHSNGAQGTLPGGQSGDGAHGSGTAGLLEHGPGAPPAGATDVGGNGAGDRAGAGATSSPNSAPQSPLSARPAGSMDSARSAAAGDGSSSYKPAGSETGSARNGSTSSAGTGDRAGARAGADGAQSGAGPRAGADPSAGSDGGNGDKSFNLSSGRKDSVAGDISTDRPVENALGVDVSSGRPVGEEAPATLRAESDRSGPPEGSERPGHTVKGPGDRPGFVVADARPSPRNRTGFSHRQTRPAFQRTRSFAPPRRRHGSTGRPGRGPRAWR